MAAVLLVSAFGFAQKLNVVGLSGIDVQYKRCVVNGSSCYFDFVVTNVSSQSSAYFEVNTGVDCQFGRLELMLCDDEGNILKQGTGFHIHDCTIGNEKTYNAYIPNNVPVKVRIPFTNIDEYASVFTLFRIPLRYNGNSNYGYLELRNIPIVRRDQ